MKQLCRTWCLIIGILLIAIPRGLTQEDIAVVFYSDTLRLPVLKGLELRDPVRMTPLSVERFSQRVQGGISPGWTGQVSALQDRYRLNDWLLYRLLQKYFRELPGGEHNTNAEIATHAALRAMGLKSHLAFGDNRVFVYVESADQVYQLPYIEAGGRSLYNITYHSAGMTGPLPQIYLLEDEINPGQRQFSFNLDGPPLLRPALEKEEIAFWHRGVRHQYRFWADANVKLLLNDHPVLAEAIYFRYPFSEGSRKSLLPMLTKSMKGMQIAERVEYLVTISRSAFTYRSDEAAYGQAKPLAAEELFFYRYSDCEDKSAWLFQMIRECLDLPAVVIGIGDHVTVGVAIPGFAGEHIEVDGEKFFICDPTGPEGSAEIGRFPAGYEHLPWEILWQQM